MITAEIGENKAANPNCRAFIRRLMIARKTACLRTLFDALKKLLNSPF